MSEMEEHLSISFDGKLTYPAYNYIPVRYLVCEGDKVITPELQRRIVGTARRDIAAGVDAVFYSGGHCVNISMPEAIVEVIRKPAGREIYIEQRLESMGQNIY